MKDFNELKRLAEDCIRQCDDGRKFADALKLMQRWTGPTEILALLAENEALRKNADRYQVLRQADVDTIHNGGLFAGLTPDNIVINGSDLDGRVDAMLALRKVVTP
ncbi:hypothetical protein BK666_01965 [Pseudomonas frederiksbergensis]|uniref:Uncharacterized protein n=1 Tax=Pseudomonas frederiksbergensis TaxID=104087 RepID=A0A423KIB5_9PSED|nr:hypothetical protein [Pseudomonas frederiksbergensis]RON52890.1 hypothetical protein BK666_01965 [Pseudomonas frederiksbergensis]